MKAADDIKLPSEDKIKKTVQKDGSVDFFFSEPIEIPYTLEFLQAYKSLAKLTIKALQDEGYTHQEAKKMFEELETNNLPKALQMMGHIGNGYNPQQQLLRSIAPLLGIQEPYDSNVAKHEEILYPRYASLTDSIFPSLNDTQALRPLIYRVNISGYILFSPALVYNAPNANLGGMLLNGLMRAPLDGAGSYFFEYKPQSIGLQIHNPTNSRMESGAQGLSQIMKYALKNKNSLEEEKKKLQELRVLEQMTQNTSSLDEIVKERMPYVSKLQQDPVYANTKKEPRDEIIIRMIEAARMYAKKQLRKKGKKMPKRKIKKYGAQQNSDYQGE